MDNCINCQFYDTIERDCSNEQWEKSHCRYDEPSPCEFYVERKKCPHKYEDCDINGCSIICHSMPSERGCKFYYKCELDDYPCNEKCEIHFKRKELEDKKNELSELHKTKKLIEKLIDRTNTDSNKLQEELNQ